MFEIGHVIVECRLTVIRNDTTAANDYSVEIPISDFAAYRVVLALKMNGEILRTEVGYGRSIWQIKELVVEE